MKTILLTGWQPSTEIQNYMSTYNYKIIAPGKISEKELLEYMEYVDAYIPGGDERVTPPIIEASKNLKIISFCGVGYEYYVDAEAARKKNVAVTNVPGANSFAVAEFTISLILLQIKNIVHMNSVTKNGAWETFEVADVSKKVIGIVGMGHIGYIVAKILHNCFHCDILYYSRNRKIDVENELDAKLVSLHELCRNSDVISIHCSYSEETERLIDEKCFECMKSTAILVNTSRAEIVAYKPLRDALLSNKIQSAGFDCYYAGGEEIKNKKSYDTYGLLSLPDEKFILTPHIAYTTPISHKNVEAVTFQNIIDIIEFGECKNRVV